jgi:pentatricopeptide repeat protein
MLMRYRFTIGIICFIVLLAGIVGLTTYQKPDTDSVNQSPQTNSTQTKTDLFYSEEFYSLENELLNNKIDSADITKKISKLNSEFEKDYLAALLLFRSGNYESSFELMLKYLSSLPGHYTYYEKLADASKISDQTEPLKERLKDENIPNNNFKTYLEALILFKAGDFENSVNQLQKGFNSGFSSKEFYYLLASNYRSTGNYEAGLETLLEAEALCTEKDPFLPKILNAQGSLYYLSAFYDEALKLYEKANAISKENGQTSEELRSLGNLALIDDLYGNVEEARKKLNQAISGAEAIQNKDLLAFFHSELGVSYTFTNNLIEARNNYRKSLKLFSELRNDERLAYLSSNIASLYLNQANYSSSLEYYEMGLSHAKNNILAQTLNLLGIADVYSNLSNYSKAIEYYKKAKVLSDSVKDISSALKIESGLGSLYFNINRPQTALTILKDAEKMLDMESVPFEAAELYHKIGVVFSSIDSIDQAIDYFKKGIELTSTTGDLYTQLVLKTELANNYYLKDDLKPAINLLNEANALSIEYQLTHLRGLQQTYYGMINQKQKLFVDAIKNFHSGFTLSGEATDLMNQVECGYQLAKLYEELNDRTQSEEWYLKTTDIIEKTSQPLISDQKIQIAHFSGISEIYNSLINFYLSVDDPEKAFEVIEKSRSRNTLQNVYHLNLLSRLGDEEKIEKFIDTRWMISSNLYDENTKDSLRLILEDISKELKPGISERLMNYPWLSFKEISSKLDKNENLLSFFVYKDYVAAFLIKSGTLSFEKIEIGADSLNQLVKNISPYFGNEVNDNEIYTNHDLFAFNAQSAFQLYEILFKKNIDRIPEGETVVISFPSEMLQLPAEFLVTEWKEGNSPYYYDDIGYLVSRNQVLYSPSASIYVNMKARNVSDNTQNLIVGDPSISNNEFSLSYRGGLLEESSLTGRSVELFPLYYSKYEAETLNSLIPNGVLLLSDEATESNFKQYAESSKIIHLSSHSFLYKDQPLILLSQITDTENDGYLEVEEIMGLNLNSDLVVLSSCRSGLGKIDEAEGIIGMQKAFFEAGANSIVVSLWDVSDKYTSVFMESFYENIMNGMSKTEALRNAKLSFIKNHSANPYYWSSFVLAGNPSPLKLEKPTSVSLILTFILVIALIVYLTFRYLRKPQTA